MNSILATKRQSNNGSSFTTDKDISNLTPVKNQKKMYSRNTGANTMAAGSTISHSKAYQNMLPKMPNVEDYMKASPK